jgi:hypothetical protein
MKTRLVGKIKLKFEITMNVSMVISNYLQEVDTMNSHIFEHIVSEDSKDAILSIEFFIAMAVAISLVGLMFFAVV